MPKWHLKQTRWESIYYFCFYRAGQALSELSATNLRVEQLSRRVDNLNHYVDDILRDQNDINEATALQIDLIQDSLAELHAEKTERDEENTRRRIGFRVEKDETEKKK